MTDSFLEDLRGRFRETAPARLDQVTSLLARLEQAPADRGSLTELARHFHAFAGMAGTYGFPRVSELGDEAEGAILPLIREDRVPDAALIERWKRLAGLIRGELSVDPEVPMPSIPGRNTPKFRVTVIDRERTCAFEIAGALEREDMEVRIASSTEDALVGELPDAVIVCEDEARELLDALRSRREEAPVGTIVIGDEGQFFEKVRAIRSGADAFMARPVDVTALVRRVGALRERKERPARRILAVEDDATTAAVIRGFLGAAGYDVVVCGEPKDFENTLHTVDPDLLLMDVQLSDDVTGHDLVRYVRQSERFSTLPVIIVTSNSERRAILDGANAGADMLVAKPVDWDLLLSQIAARLERATVVRELTDRDTLTGVLTRGAFDTRVRRRVEHGEGAVFVLMDLDHFKEVNDTWGHDTGDHVLVSMGTLLRRGVRQSDVVARYGGEEFVLLLDGLSVEGAARLCERLLAEFQRIDHGKGLQVTFSAGVAALAGSFEATFRRADAALYEAKRSGRARIVTEDALGPPPLPSPS